MSDKDPTKNALESIAAELKAEAIIDSCTKCEHIENAKLYIELFNERFNMIHPYKRLCNLLEAKKLKLKCFN